MFETEFANNPVVDFVVKNVDNFESLNASSEAESEGVFRSELIKALEKQTAGKQIGDIGGQFLVQELSKPQRVSH